MSIIDYSISLVLSINVILKEHYYPYNGNSPHIVVLYLHNVAPISSFAFRATMVTLSLSNPYCRILSDLFHKIRKTRHQNIYKEMVTVNSLGHHNHKVKSDILTALAKLI